VTIARSTTRRGLLAIVALLYPAWLSAQTTSARTATAPAGPSWSFVFTGDLYLVPDSPSFASPVLTADRGWLHLEARYNYEGRATGSFWFGCNFSVGQRLTLEVTPMIAAVVGETAGVAPGYQVALSYGRLSISDTGEYVLNVNDRTASFFYAWPQVAYSLSDWLKVGIAAQRTKVYHTDFDIQRGALVGFAVGPVEFTSYVFAGKPSPTVVLEGVVSF
jgi:hypothetical protein